MDATLSEVTAGTRIVSAWKPLSKAKFHDILVLGCGYSFPV